MAHCTACGARTEPFEERHARCPACKHTDWNNPVPAVGVAILRGEDILLAKRARDPKKGQWDLVGGFVEPHESAREAVTREVAEETGLTLSSAELVDILPGDYDGRPTINMLYIGQADGEPKPHDDVASLDWFPVNDLPEALAWPHEAEMLAQVAALVAQIKQMAGPN